MDQRAPEPRPAARAKDGARRRRSPNSRGRVPAGLPGLVVVRPGAPTSCECLVLQGVHHAGHVGKLEGAERIKWGRPALPSWHGVDSFGVCLTLVQT